MHALGNVDQSLKEQLKNDYKSADLTELDKIILTYVEKLTLTPGKIVAEDVKILKEAELTNQAIHDIVQVVSYFSYVNRMADGLGIELEESKE